MKEDMQIFSSGYRFLPVYTFMCSGEESEYGWTLETPATP